MNQICYEIWRTDRIGSCRKKIYVETNPHMNYTTSAKMDSRGKKEKKKVHVYAMETVTHNFCSTLS
jgi:predicted RNase H-related nuclease YkuK (DUF458 family)